MQTSAPISTPSDKEAGAASRGDSARLDLRSVRRVFPGNIVAVSDVNLSINPAELVAIVGPSGSGKTTLLRMIAGLEPLDSGEIVVDSQSVGDRPPHLRDLALVFQDPALLPHLSVEQNLSIGLKYRGLKRVEIRRRIQTYSHELDIIHLLNRSPGALSGGERRRVALARALVRLPRLLLLDEPLSNLDGPLRIATRDLIARISLEHSLTTLLVTHDQADALAVGDRVVVMNQGIIEQVGTPDDIYLRPKTRFVASFIGDPPMNLLPCAIAREGDRIKLRIEGIDSPIADSNANTADVRFRDRIERSGTDRFDLAFRSENVLICNNLNGPESPIDPNRVGAIGSHAMIEAVVARLEYRGYETIATLTAGEHEIKARLKANAQIRVLDRVFARFDLGLSQVFV